MEKYSEIRPWGHFEQFCKNKKCTVKILEVKPYQALSLQFHYNRDEFWKILSGKPKIIIDNKIFDGKEGDEFYIPKETKHRIKTEESIVRILEIAFGEFDENDIVRLEDVYNRI